MTMLEMSESRFQHWLKREIKERLSGAIVLKNDPTFLQGIPDLLVLYKDHWAALEVKTSADAPYRPNQQYYIGRMNCLSFARVIYPEIADDVLLELELFMKGARRDGI